MAYDFNWLEEMELDIKAGIGFINGEEKYIAALQRFYKGFEKKSRQNQSVL